jgi:hypothetical protein
MSYLTHWSPEMEKTEITYNIYRGMVYEIVESFRINLDEAPKTTSLTFWCNCEKAKSINEIKSFIDELLINP